MAEAYDGELRPRQALASPPNAHPIHVQLRLHHTALWGQLPWQLVYRSASALLTT